MEKWVEELFNEEVLQLAADLYGGNSANAKKLGDFENYVYEIHKGDKPCILRLTHSSHRSREQVVAELEWVNYLHSTGVNVSLVSHSAHGNLVEEIQAGKTSFYVCLFDKAPGSPVGIGSDLLGPALYQEWGRTIGKMNRVTKDFKEGQSLRAHWYDDDLLVNISNYLPAEDLGIIHEAKAIVETLQGFTAESNEYGLVHSDLHLGNFFYSEGEIHVFDFDDSSYHWFSSDIAIPLYYSTWGKLGRSSLEERSAFGEEFLMNFLIGYYRENDLEDQWIMRIPLFLKLRDIVLYTVFHKKFDINNRSEREAGAVAGIRKRLIDGEPMVQLDYEKILSLVKKA
jgi:amicoumacin kinase